MQSVKIRFEWYHSKEGKERKLECRYARRKKGESVKAKIMAIPLRAKDGKDGQQSTSS